MLIVDADGGSDYEKYYTAACDSNGVLYHTYSVQASGSPSPETLGHSGFNIAFEYQVAQIDNNANYWPSNGLIMRSPSIEPRSPKSSEYSVSTPP